jgi:hypothetical protein
LFENTQKGQNNSKNWCWAARGLLKPCSKRKRHVWSNQKVYDEALQVAFSIFDTHPQHFTLVNAEHPSQ